MSLKEEILQQINNDFMNIKDKKVLTDDDIGALETGITGLLGIYRIKKEEHVYNMIKEIITFSEERGVDMSASRLLFWNASKKK
jgi:hypothetical protein